MLEKLIGEYGVLAVFLGAAVEGETAAFLGGIFAHRQLIPYWQVALAACLGSFAADQFFFLSGRYATKWSYVQKRLASEPIARVTRLLEAHPTGFILAFRFIYGIRTISPVAIGISSISTRRFVILNAIAALIWGILITAIGFVAGGAVEELLGRLQLHLHLLIALAVVAILVPVSAYAFRREMGRRTARLGRRAA
ncbi:membrane protein DedA, SNARE-associated domain [Rhizobium tibeticum]|uniref:Inner membrane protein YohD n=1 Tax=Rhizobium tibeticum TaxID=501024 RepID=A0A1H8RW89_9HYPH|nr:DedA family protein [Rhizobium tibeticum]SEI08300.1 Inner membrane protein YohD [Rhizobium tibeticum]SEO70454.1 membrane protein DedA, SNARE-associated domain [Rhizobium tibeticum]